MEPKIQASLCFEHVAYFDEKHFDCVIFDSRIVETIAFGGVKNCSQIVGR